MLFTLQAFNKHNRQASLWAFSSFSSAMLSIVLCRKVIQNTYLFSKSIAAIGRAFGIDWKTIQRWFVGHYWLVMHIFGIMNQKFHWKVRTKKAAINGYSLEKERTRTLRSLIWRNVNIITARTVKLYTMLSTDEKNCAFLALTLTKFQPTLLHHLQAKQEEADSSRRGSVGKHMAVNLSFLEHVANTAKGYHSLQSILRENKSLMEERIKFDDWRLDLINLLSFCPWPTNS